MGENHDYYKSPGLANLINTMNCAAFRDIHYVDRYRAFSPFLNYRGSSGQIRVVVEPRVTQFRILPT